MAPSGDTSKTPVGKRRLAAILSTLSDRDKSILTSLHALHYATTHQLERLHFHQDLTASSARRLPQRTLARLNDVGLIRDLDRRVGGMAAGSDRFVWTLSPIGARAVSHPVRRRVYEPGPSSLAHVLAVGDLVVELNVLAHRGEVDLLRLETEPECWRPYIRSHGGRAWLKPDLRVTLGVGRYVLHWFVELDRGTAHRPALRRKNLAYIAAWKSGVEQLKAGVFPRVLWIAPDSHRATELQRICASLQGAPPEMFRHATTDDAIEALIRVPARNTAQ